MNDLRRPQSEAHLRQTNAGRAPVAPALKKSNSIYEVQGKWRRRGADVRLVVSCTPGEPCRLEIDFLGIPRSSRNKGYGSKLMQELTRAADSRKMDILLTPENSDRSEGSRRFFERHGFKPANGEDGPFAWMVRKTGRRAEKGQPASSVQKEAQKPKVTSLFMENAARFKRGCKDVLAEYGGVGKVDHCASGSKVYYGFYSGERDQRRPPYPGNVPQGHFAQWNESRREYEFFPKEEAYGGVVFNDKGEILLRMAAGHADGAAIWTFSSGRAAEDGRAPQEAAKQEIREETGIEAKILSELPGSFEGDTAFTHYYIMRPVSEARPSGAQTAQIAWLKPEDARGSISQTADEKVKQRDLAVLEAALKYVKEAFEDEIKKSFSIFYAGSEESADAGELEASEERAELSGRDIQNALIYWGRKENRTKYPAQEQREILARILAAAQKNEIDPEFLKAE